MLKVKKFSKLRLASFNYMPHHFWHLRRRIEFELFGWRFDLWLFQQTKATISEGEQHYRELPEKPYPEKIEIKDEWLKTAVNPNCEPIMVPKGDPDASK